MYVYFDENGILKEIISDKSFRVGDSKRDKIYVYWEGEHAPVSGWVKYRKPNGKEYPDLMEECFYQLGDQLVGKTLPNKPLRNLKYFSYDHTYEENGETHIGYQFYEITIPDAILNSSIDNEKVPTENNMVIARIRFVMDDGNVSGEMDKADSIEALGALVFSVETNIGILTDSSINETQYNYLIQLVSMKLGTNTKSVKVTQLPSTGVAGTIYYVERENNGIVYDAYFWNGTEFVFMGTTSYGLYTKQEGDDFELAIQTLWNTEMTDYKAFMNSSWANYQNTINTQIANLSKYIQSAASGSPKGVYSTLNALQTAYPSGTNGIYVVGENGHWYYWNGSAWTDGGIYQSSVNYDDLNPKIKVLSANFSSFTEDVDITNLLEWKNYALHEGVEAQSSTRLSSSYFYGNADTLVECADGYKIAFTKYDLNGNYIRSTEYLDQNYNKLVYLDGNGLYRITLAKSDNSNITPSDYVNNVTITQLNKNKKQAPNYGKDYIEGLTFELGNYTSDTNKESTNRCRSMYVRLPAYTKIYSNNSKFYLYMFVNGCTRNPATTTGGWVTEYYTTEDIVCHIILAHTNDDTITDINSLQRTLHAYYIGNEYFINSLTPIKVNTISCSILGTISDGVHYDNPTNRIHTDFFKVEKGMYISVNGYKCSLQFYNTNNENSYYKQIYWVGCYYYLIKESCYLRVVCANFDDSSISANDASVEVGWCGTIAHNKVCPKINRDFALVSHRGLHNQYTENTLNAFKASVTAGYKYIETDIHWTSDNVPVASHDATFMGVTIATATAEQCVNAGICLIKDFLVLCKTNNVIPILEPKTDMTYSQAVILHNMLNDMNMLSSIISGFSKISLIEMLSLHNYDVMIANNYDSSITQTIFENAMNIYSNNNNVYVGFFNTDYTDSAYALAKNAGAKLAFYSTDTISEAYNWATHSDMIYTNELTPPIV